MIWAYSFILLHNRCSFHTSDALEIMHTEKYVVYVNVCQLFLRSQYHEYQGMTILESQLVS